MCPGVRTFPTSQPGLAPNLGNDRGSQAISTGAITACGEMNHLANRHRTADFFFSPMDVTHFKIGIE